MSRLRKAFRNPYRKVNIGPIYLKYLKHLPQGKLHSHKLLGHDTWFYNGQEYLHGINEIFIDEIYNQVLPADALIIDCGANIGLSVIYLKSICPSARVVAFEPDPSNFELLQRNISAHGLEKVELKQEAVWKEKTMISFASEGTMSSRISTETTQLPSLTQAIRLKDYLTQKIDFLKMDIEGAEYEVLRDIQKDLGCVNNLFVEYHGTFQQTNELTELFAIFTKAGFDYYIKEATPVYQMPFIRDKNSSVAYDVQLNIFCSRPAR